MDLVEEILDISHELSSLKIHRLLEAISRRVPHVFLPCLVILIRVLNDSSLHSQ